MLKVNLNDGRTLRYDLTNPAEAASWADLAGNHSFQQKITALSLLLNGVSYSIPRPREFGDLFVFAEAVEEDTDARIKGGERLLLQAGDVQILLMAHNGQRAARVDVTRTGRQRYNPLQRVTPAGGTP